MQTWHSTATKNLSHTSNTTKVGPRHIERVLRRKANVTRKQDAFRKSGITPPGARVVKIGWNPQVNPTHHGFKPGWVENFLQILI